MTIKYINCESCKRKVSYNQAVNSPDGFGDLCIDCYNSWKMNERLKKEQEEQKELVDDASLNKNKQEKEKSGKTKSK